MALAFIIHETSDSVGVATGESRSWRTESVTLFAAGGAALHVFTTGQGNIIANPIIPVAKVTANPKTAASRSEHVDLDVSRDHHTRGELDQAADRLVDLIVATASGRFTAAEALRHREFVLTRLHRTA